MMEATGSYVSWWGWGSYVAVGETSSRYLTSRYEDWAETVAAAVYPTHNRFVDARGKPRMGKERRNYIQPFLPNSTLFSTSGGKP